MFEISKKDLTLANMTTRTENHGEEHVPAVSLRVELSTSNDVLDAFAPGIREALFKAKQNAEAQNIQPDMLSEICFPRLKPLTFDIELEGYRLLIVNDVDHNNNDHIVGECKLKSFKFELIDGGSVKVSFTINCQPNAAAVGYFYEQQKHSLFATLEPPAQLAVEEMGEEMGEAKQAASARRTIQKGRYMRPFWVQAEADCTRATKASKRAFLGQQLNAFKF